MRQATLSKGPSAAPEDILTRTAPEAIRQLFIDLLEEGYIIRSLAAGESMTPCIKKGDLLVVKPIVLEEARIGEVVAFRKEESHSVLTTHRVVARGKDGGQRCLITQGDRNLYRDLPLSPQDVLGKVVGIERKGQLISLETPFYRLRGYLIARWSMGLWILGVLKRKLQLFNQSGRSGNND
jgi:signal peptidase I